MESKFKENLKEYRLEEQLKQKELALILHVHHSTVSAWELGRNQPDYDMLIKLADFFNVTTDEFLGRENF